MVKIQAGRSKKAMTSTSSSSSSPSLSKSSNEKKYKGVRMRSWGSWVSEIRAPNQKTRIWLGSYSTAEAAARAYDAALLCLKGSSANLNFPLSPSHFIPDTVLSPKSIQKVAAAAANSFATAAVEFACTDNITTRPESSPPPQSASPSQSLSSSSSSICARSSYDQLDVCEEVTLMQPFDYSLYTFDDQLQSPKFLDDQMFINNGADSSCSSFCSSAMIDDFLESDIRLWSFAE